MQLLLDLGNSRLKAVLYQNGQFQQLTFDSVAGLLKLPVTAAYLSSVATEQKTTELLHSLQAASFPTVQLHTEASAFGLSNSYVEPQRLGVDRWLAMLGAYRSYPAARQLIVDAGTAVTFDWLEENRHLGGWILPGLQLQQQALLAQTARVHKTQQLMPNLAPGCSTSAGVENGALAAIIGAIRLGWQTTPAQQLLLTGGDAELLKSYLPDLPVLVDPFLLFRGIAQYIVN